MATSLMDVQGVIDCAPDAIELIERIQIEYLKRNQEFFHIVLSRADVALRDKVIAVYNDMDEGSRARVLLSTELGAVFSDSLEAAGSDPQNIQNMMAQRLYGLIAREHALTRLEAGEPASYLDAEAKSEVWSPLGDRVARRVDGEWRLSRSLIVGGHIVLDFDSPLAVEFVARSGVFSQPILPVSEEERVALQAKLNETLGKIDAIEPVYGALIRNFTRRIFIRKNAQTQDEAKSKKLRISGSEHSSALPGAIKLLNFHFPERTTIACTESLLHESIHVMLANYERFSGYFTSRGNSVRPVSPWSGNLIPNASLSHAIFIYYACYRMFSAGAAPDSALSEADRRYMASKIQHFASGFLVSQPLSGLFVDNKPLRDGMGACLDAMQDRVRAYYSEQLRKAA